MATSFGRIRSSPYSLPDLRRRPGRSFFYTGPPDPVVTKAARSGSVPATTVGGGKRYKSTKWNPVCDPLKFFEKRSSDLVYYIAFVA